MKDRFHPQDLMLANGKLFNIGYPRAEDVDLVSFIHSICHQTRFNGHLPAFYSVGCHTLVMYAVATAMEESAGMRKGILLHDLHEAITGDIPTPVKRLLQPTIGELEGRIDAAVFEHFGHLQTPAEKARIKLYDDLMWQCELHVLKDVPWDCDDELAIALCGAVSALSGARVSDIVAALQQSIRNEFDAKEIMQ